MNTAVNQFNFDKAVANKKRMLTERTRNLTEIQSICDKALGLYVTLEDAAILVEFRKTNYEIFGSVDYNDPESLQGLINSFIQTFVNLEFKW